MSSIRASSPRAQLARWIAFVLVLCTSGLARAQQPAEAADAAVVDPVEPPTTTAAPTVPEPSAPIVPPPVAAPPEPEPPGPEVVARLGQGLTVRSADGRFSITLRGRAQLRYEGVFDELRRGAEGSSTFQARRVRLLLQGTLFGEDFQYYLQLGFSNRDTESDLRLPLRDAYLTYSGLRDLHVRVGQMKVPYGRQRVVSSSALQFPDRSIVTGEFNLDRDVGVQVFSSDLFGLGERLGYNLGIFGGDGRNRTGSDFGMLYVARLTTTPFGKFDEFVEADHARGETPRLSLSIGGAINMNSIRSRSTFEQTNAIGSFDFVHAGFDTMFKYRGLSIVAEVFYRDVLGTREHVDATDPADVITVTSRTGFGYYAQAGYMLSDHVEVVGRFGEIRSRLRGGPTALTDTAEFGAGLNYYFQRHDFKVQLDWYLQQVGGVIDADAREHHIRLQTQFYL